MDDFGEIEPKPLSRWVTVPLGLLLTPFTLLCVIGSASLLIAPNVPPTLLTVSLSSLFMAGSIWVFLLSLRLVFANPRKGGNFISPFALRAIALVFVAIPVAALVTGSFSKNAGVHSVMTILYMGIVVRLFSMARVRAQNSSSHEHGGAEEGRPGRTR